MTVEKKLVYDVSSRRLSEVEEDMTLPPTVVEEPGVDLKSVREFHTKHFDLATKTVKADKFEAPNATLGEMEITTTSSIHHGKSFSRGQKIIEPVDGLVLSSPTKKWIIQVSDEGIISAVEVV